MWCCLQCCWNTVSGHQMRPMNPPGDPKSYHRWSVWRPMDSLGFAENVSGWKWTNDSTDLCTDIKCSLCLSKMRAPFGPFWQFFYWLHGLSRLLIGRLPRTETDHPTINHRWSVRRARILHLLQHCCLAGCVGSVRQFVVVTDAAVKKTPGYWIWWNVTWVKATCSYITWFESSVRD